MTFRQPAKLLTNMAEMVEVISLDRLNPVCFERFEPEDVSSSLRAVSTNVRRSLPGRDSMRTTILGYQNLELGQERTRKQGS